MYICIYTHGIGRNNRRQQLVDFQMNLRWTKFSLCIPSWNSLTYHIDVYSPQLEKTEAASVTMQHLETNRQRMKQTQVTMNCLRISLKIISWPYGSLQISIGPLQIGSHSVMKMFGVPMDMYSLPYGPYGNLWISIGPL